MFVFMVIIRAIHVPHACCPGVWFDKNVFESTGWIPEMVSTSKSYSLILNLDFFFFRGRQITY